MNTEMNIHSDQKPHPGPLLPRRGRDFSSRFLQLRTSEQIPVIASPGGQQVSATELNSPSPGKERAGVRSSVSSYWMVTILCGLLLLVGFPAAGKMMENGVDPENLGTGDWVYYLSTATDRLGGNVESVTDVPSLMAFYKSMGIDWIAVKAGTGAAEFPSAKNPQFTKELVDAAHAGGIKIFGYSRSDGKDVPGEIQLALKVYELGADGFIIDAETEWEPHILGKDGRPGAIELCQGIKKVYPNNSWARAVP